MWHRLRFTPLIALAILLGAIFNYGCSKMDSNASRGITLDSGLDKKSAPGSMDMAESSSGYDSNYRAQTTGSEAVQYGSAAGAAAPASGSTKPAPHASSDAYGMDLGASIDRWMNPVAYAQDTKIDEKYLVRNGDLTVEVEDFNKKLDEVYAIATRRGGIVTDSQIAGSGDSTSGFITLRVPNSAFFATWNELVKLGEATAQNISSEDVSRQYVAAVSRLKNLTLEQDTLRQMLNEALEVQRKRGLGEGYSILLDTQNRLSEVTGQIQSVEDEISALADRITRSTIKVNLVQRPKYEPEKFSWGLGATFDRAKKDLALAVAGLLNGLIYFAVAGWLWLLPWLIALFIGWKVYRRYIAPKLAAPAPVVSAITGGKGE